MVVKFISQSGKEYPFDNVIHLHHVGSHTFEIEQRNPDYPHSGPAYNRTRIVEVDRVEFISR